MKNNISVVIPLYNKEKSIRRCLDSVLRQTVLPMEIVIVDDGSTDSSRAIAESYNTPLIRLLVKNNGGVSSARNHGIQEAQGDIIAFLDADDTWEPDFLLTVEYLAEMFQEATIFSTGFRRIFSSRTAEISVVGSGRQEFLIFDYFSLAAIYSFITSSNTAVRKDAFNRVGLFTEGENYSEDQEMWARLATFSPIAYSSKILANYYCNSTGKLPNLSKYVISAPIVVKTLKSLLQNEDISPEKKIEIKTMINKKIYERFEGNCFFNSRRVCQRFLGENLVFDGIGIKYRLILLSLNIIPCKMFYYLGKIRKSYYLSSINNYLAPNRISIYYYRTKTGL